METLTDKQLLETKITCGETGLQKWTQCSIWLKFNSLKDRANNNQELGFTKIMNNNGSSLLIMLQFILWILGKLTDQALSSFRALQANAPLCIPASTSAQCACR